MASTWFNSNTNHVAASVSEFTGVMGYCEYEAPMVLQKIKTKPSKAVLAGLEAHIEEEEYEKEHVVLEEVTLEQIADPIQNIEFPREYIHTRMQSNIKIDNKDTIVTLYGRTDKMKRTNSVLSVEDDKFPEKVFPYLKKDTPYDNQLLQILVYLNSDYSHHVKDNDDWFEIEHVSKEWVINIRDKHNNNMLVKRFSGKCDTHETAHLNRTVERFASLLLGAIKPIHHNTVGKCIVCKYRSMCQAKMDGA
ncbi:MAG: hypothetical protein K8823_537 [Cenarchaeum symbiont of Oopsacas minuta]|nr:hypothetical protein [Cenarchaeum symbiont of Oopsacas minuta]